MSQLLERYASQLFSASKKEKVTFACQINTLVCLQAGFFSSRRNKKKGSRRLHPPLPLLYNCMPMRGSLILQIIQNRMSGIHRRIKNIFSISMVNSTEQTPSPSINSDPRSPSTTVTRYKIRDNYFHWIDLSL
jgi:hypothetical protein